MNRIRGRITYPPEPAPVVDAAPRSATTGRKLPPKRPPQKRKSKWNDWMDGIIKAECCAKPASELAARLGVTKNDVYQRAYKFKLQKRPTYCEAQRLWRKKKAEAA